MQFKLVLNIHVYRNNTGLVGSALMLLSFIPEVALSIFT